MQWLQDPHQSNVYNVNNVSHKAIKHFRNKKEYQKAKIDEPETNSTIKNISDMDKGFIDFKRCYQLRNNIVKDEEDDLVTDSHSIWARWRNHFSQLLNVHGVNDVRQTEIHIAQPLVHESSAFEIEIGIEKLKRYISPGIDQIPAELIKAGGGTLCSEIHELILFELRMNCLRSGRR